MSSVIIAGDVSGTVTLQAPSAAGSTVIDLPATSGTMAVLPTATSVLPEAQGGTGTTTGYYGFKNRIINGAMVIDQRNAGASVTAGSAYTLDRWNVDRVWAGSTVTIQQSSTAPAGFVNSLVATVSTGAAVAAGSTFNIQQFIEGYNIADMGFGTASAQAFTVSFWVRSSVTGTFGVGFRNGAFDLSYWTTYTINAANTWEQKSVTIAGPTTGTWYTNNSYGLNLDFSLGCGSTYKAASNNAWNAGNKLGAIGETDLIATTGATFYITGVQLEKGSTATSFDYRPYGTELALCQRYFQVCGFSGVGYNTTEMGISSQFKVTMRAQPSMSTVLYNGDNYTGTANTIVRVGIGNAPTTSASYNTASFGNNIGNILTTGLAAGGIYFGSFQVSAEL